MLPLVLFLVTYFTAPEPNPLVRIAEIRLNAGYEKAYLEILNEEVRISLENEPGVWAILPTVDGNIVRILEVYADSSAYHSHIQSPHFLYYKESTADMISALRLHDVRISDKAFLRAVLKKAK